MVEETNILQDSPLSKGDNLYEYSGIVGIPGFFEISLCKNNENNVYHAVNFGAATGTVRLY